MQLIDNIEDNFVSLLFENYIADQYYPKIKFYFNKVEDQQKFIDLYLKKFNFDIGNCIVDDICNSKIEEDVVTVCIKDYNLFFNYLKTYCNDLALLKNRDYVSSSFAVEIIKNLFLRATSEDLNDVELFLKKQIDMIEDSLLSSFYSETIIGKLYNMDLSIKVCPAELFDENSLELSIKLKKDEEEVELPVIRYGIYNNGSNKVCSIGSIQNKFFDDDSNISDIKKDFIKGIKRNDRWGVDSKKCLSLIIFLLVMNANDINDFEIHGYNILDYQFHEKLSEFKSKMFFYYYLDGLMPSKYDPNYQYYEDNKKDLDRYYNKQDFIIETKTTKFFEMVNKVLEYYFNSYNIKSYPYELDSNFHFSIPKLDQDSINGDISLEIFNIINNYFSKKDNGECSSKLLVK